MQVGKIVRHLRPDNLLALHIGICQHHVRRELGRRSEPDTNAGRTVHSLLTMLVLKIIERKAALQLPEHACGTVVKVRAEMEEEG